MLTKASSADAIIHKKMFRSGMRPSDLINQTTLIISGEKMDGIMKVKLLEESPL